MGQCIQPVLHIKGLTTVDQKQYSYTLGGKIGYMWTHAVQIHVVRGLTVYSLKPLILTL